MQSESDKSLSCVFNQTGVLSVGSLVSFRKTDMPEFARLLGVVDKVIVAKQSRKIIFGMKLLASEFISVDYCQPDGNANGNGNANSSPSPTPTPNTNAAAPDAQKPSAPVVVEVLKKGLFYNIKELEYIITDTFMLKDDDVLRIHDSHDSFSVVLKNRKNVGLGYWQFECVRIREKKKHISIATNKKGYDFI